MSRSTDREPLVFRSRRAGWLVPLMLGGVAALALACLWMIASGRPVAVAVGVGFAVVGVPAGLWPLWTSYVLDDDGLRARSGPFSVTLAWRELKRVERTASMRAAPALATDRRLLLVGSSRELVVTPEEEERFLEAVRDHAPHADVAV